jgi:predicted transcriptional regulator
MMACRTLNEYLVVDANETLSKVIPKLKKDKQVVVFDKEKYIGIVTRKNILREGINLPEEKISSLTFKPPSIYENTSDLDIAKYFIESGAHFLPVLNNDDKNKIECIVYRNDFLKDIVLPNLKGMKVSDIANVTVKTISKEDNLAKALSTFHEYGISKLIVFENAKLFGVLTLSTILGQFMHETQISKSKLQNTLVKEIMKEEVYTIDKDEELYKAINLFVDTNSSSVVVLDNNALYGIITKTDILERFVYALEQEQKQSSIQISAKFPGLNRQEIEDKFLQLEKFGKETKVFVYYKMGKEKFRGLPLINCRVRVIVPKHTYSVSVEGWGIDHATELAVEKLKRQMGDVRF